MEATRPRFGRHGWLGAVALGAVALGAGSIASAGAQTVPEGAAPAGSSQQPVVLDSVIAVINGDVLLRSDLQNEMNMADLEPLTLPAGKNFERRAARRLINRTLILQQMQSQGMVKEISDEEVQKDLDALREQLPDCRKSDCKTEAGWTAFLAERNLTPNEVTERWRQRMQILNFIDARFRAGVRISKTDIEDYYNKTLVPEFEKQKLSAPPLNSVSARIEEILLQQHVNGLLQDWLKSLRDQGNVIILDPALGESNPGPADDEGDGA
jgi:peptidyl-prolyl cis-trans isomerase SurA